MSQTNRLTLTQGILTAAIGATLWATPNLGLRVIGALGMVGGLSGVARTVRSKDERKALIGYADAVVNEFEDLTGQFGEKFGDAASFAAQNGQVLVKSPEKFLTQVQRYAQTVSEDSDWIKQTLWRSVVLCAPSKSGKTFLMSKIIYDLFQMHPGCDMRIVDIDNGRSHDGTEPNDWLGAPEGMILESASEAFEYINEVADFIRNPKNKGRDNWLCLVVDEFNSTIAELSDKERSKLKHSIKTILNRGLKMKIKIVVASQSPLADELGLSSTDRIGSVEFIFLGSSIAKADFIKFVVGDTECKEVAAKASQFRKMPGRKRAALVTDEEDFALRVVPQINPEELRSLIQFV